MVDMEWDVTARNLNVIACWTSPVERTCNVSSALCFYPSD
jgi:hypothetical protein